MKYKIIATDFDGTIFSHTDYTVPENVRTALHRYMDKGGRVLLSTGRMFEAVRPYALDLGLRGEMLCLQGTVCCNLQDGRELFSLSLSQKDTDELLRYVEEQGWIYQFYHDTRMFTKSENRYSENYARICGIQPVYTREDVSAYVSAHGYRAQKIIVMSPAKLAAERVELLKEAFPLLDVTQSTPQYIEIVDGGSGKGNALRHYAKMVGIPLSEIAAFGDETNDLSMLLAAGFSAAPENAVPQVKEIVDCVFPDVSVGGAAELINKLTDLL